MKLETIRISLAAIFGVAAPVALIAGIAHTASYNSPGIVLGFAAAMILIVIAGLLAME